MISINRKIVISQNAKYSQPYWLEEEHLNDIYIVKDQNLIGRPKSDYPIYSAFSIELYGTEINLRIPVFYRRNDPVEGEVYKRIEIVPQAVVNFDKDLYLLRNGEEKEIRVIVKCMHNDLKGTVRILSEKGWNIFPESYDFSFNNKNEEKEFNFIKSTDSNSSAIIKAQLKQCGIVEAKDEIKRAQTMFKHWQTTGVENVGGGAVFLQYLRTDSTVRVVDSNLTFTGKGKVRSKPDRINIELSPWLEAGIITISDADTPYLRALKRLMDNFFDLDPNDDAWDAGDALYHAAKLYPEVLRVENHNTLNPQEMMQNVRRGLSHPMTFGGNVPHLGEFTVWTLNNREWMSWLTLFHRCFMTTGKGTNSLKRSTTL